LPYLSTLKKWYSTIDGQPGFTKEAFIAVSSKVRCREKGPLILNLVLDEISIKEQLIFHGSKFYGGVNLGTDNNIDSDCQTKAKNALVFLAVDLN
jgi:hypothetical protein